MAKLPTISSKKFTWKGREGSADCRDINCRVTTAGFYIQSARTGQKMLFLYDHATMEANEFFDGEVTAFMSPGNDVKVQLKAG